CEKEYHVGCLRDSGLCDLKELPRDKWFCCDDCIRIHVALQNLVLVGAEMIPASVSYAIHRKHVEKGFTDGVSNDDVQWRILSKRSRCPDHLPVLSRAVAIFRVSFHHLPLLMNWCEMKLFCRLSTNTCDYINQVYIIKKNAFWRRKI
ncbi:hypothetical protein HYC85_024193, partial [Camellia sinensis]